MKISIISFLVLIFSFSILSAQTIKIVNNKKIPIDSVSAYSKDTKLGESDSHGILKLSNFKAFDSIYFLKSGFYNAKISTSNIPTELQLDSLRTYNIEGVVIKNLNAKDLIAKVVETGRTNNIYSIISVR